jgi:hypothetical protein
VASFNYNNFSMGKSFINRRAITAVIIVFFLSGFIHQQSYIDPTGTYTLKSKTTKKGEDIYGYTGQIQVKKINSHKIAMTFGINRGAPSYSSGSFIDTFVYNNNEAVYFDPESDSTCKIIFKFTELGINVKEEAKDYNTACGFGHAVVADGYFRKVSGKIPVLKDPLTGEKINPE